MKNCIRDSFFRNCNCVSFAVYMTIIVMFFGGCSTKKSSAAKTESVSIVRNITDDIGRTIAIVNNPQKIVALTTTDVEILFALGRGSALVGIPDGIKYPPEALKIDRVGGLYGNFSAERVMGKEPDLVLITMSAWDNYGSNLDRLALLGIPALGYRYPESFESLYAHIKKIGLAIGKKGAADSLVVSIKGRVEKITEVVQYAKSTPHVYIEWVNSGNQGNSYGNVSRYNELISLAGGRNLFFDVSKSSFVANTEEVVSRNPEVIILAVNLEKVDITTVKKSLSLRPGFNTTDAVKNACIYVVDANITWANLRMVKGLEAFVHSIHPELFEKTQIRSSAE